LRSKASPDKYFPRPYLEKAHHKNKAGGMAQCVGPEFKPQHSKIIIIKIVIAIDTPEL
jgi:hypothetical protein